MFYEVSLTLNGRLTTYLHTRFDCRTILFYYKKIIKTYFSGSFSPLDLPFRINCSVLLLRATSTAAALNIKFAFYFRSGMHVTFFPSVGLLQLNLSTFYYCAELLFRLKTFLNLYKKRAQMLLSHLRYGKKALNNYSCNL